LIRARARTAEAVEELRGRLDLSLFPENSSLVMFGSWGRHEKTNESDVDWALIVDDLDLNLEGPRVTAAVEHLVDLFKAKPPGREQYFGTAFHAAPLSDRIGLDDDDNRNLTRRMLLVLESLPITGEDVHERVLRRVLERYLQQPGRNFWPPRFLLNDIIRYWRTICVDFEGKTERDEREGERNKFVMRNAKLRTSRKLLYASGLLPALLCRLIRAEHIPGFLYEQMRAPATDRIARAFIHLGQPDAGLRTLAAYSDWIALAGTAQARAALDALDETTRFESAEFAVVKRIGGLLDNGLLSLLFETSLSPTAQKFVTI
jgi:predicted nucleotidyltransferase